MAYRDLREYIGRLDEEGEVQSIDTEVDWNLEVGAIIRRSCDIGAPAPLFQKIHGYPRGYRIFGAPIGISNLPNRPYVRLALALGMPPDSSMRKMIDSYLERRRNGIKPLRVNSGPCKENIHLGDDIDLFEFPSPFIHDGDGGRYLGTWCTVATRDPETGWGNRGTYRMVVHERQTLGCYIHPLQHIGQHFDKYEARNQPMEVAVAIGTEPVTAIMSGVRVPPHIDEADIVGGIRGEPLEMVSCETVDLMVPATSEIVIEGLVPPRERRREGPFGEYTGYQSNDIQPRPVIQVTAITHRHDPILPVAVAGVTVEDTAILNSTFRAAELLDYLRLQKYPVKMVYCPPEAVAHIAVVSTQVPFANYSKMLAHAIWGSTAGRAFWIVIVVEEDIDPTDMRQVLWSLGTRCHPDRGIFKDPFAPAPPFLPFLNSYERQHNIGAHVIFDCTWPRDWPKEDIPVKASFDMLWPKDVQEMVIRNWKRYGYKE